jgi:plasmid stabilization system protein ParE
MFVEKIYYHTDQLLSYPLSGRIVPEIEDENIRELIYRNYRIVYRVVSKESIRILTVFHSTKNLDKKQLSD